MYIYILGVFWEYIADRQGHGTTTMGCKYIVSSLFYALTTTPGCGTFPMRTAQAKCAGLSPPRGYQKPSTRMLRTALQGKNITNKNHSQHPGVATWAQYARPRRVGAPRPTPTTTVVPNNNKDNIAGLSPPKGYQNQLLMPIL